MKTGTLPCVIVAAMVATFAACNTGGCYDNQSAVPLVEFLDTAGTSLTLQGVEIRGIGAPNDSLLVASTESSSQIYMPLRSTEQSVTWNFHYVTDSNDDGNYDDRITFEYTSKPYFASDECGAFYEYEITGYSYTTNVIDSVAVTDSLITNVDNVRISIYFDLDKIEQSSTAEEDGDE